MAMPENLPHTRPPLDQLPKSPETNPENLRLKVIDNYVAIGGLLKSGVLDNPQDEEKMDGIFAAVKTFEVSLETFRNPQE